MKKSFFWLSFLIILLLAFSNLGKYPLLETSDARYAEIAYEMEIGHNYLIPTFYGEWHLHKPPLVYWLTILGYKLWGLNEWGARFFQGVIYVGIFCLNFFFYSRFVEEELALLISLAINVSFPIFASSHVLTTDLGLLFFELLALYSFFILYFNKVAFQNRGYFKFLFWLALVFSFLIKGPIGHLIVFPIIIIFLHSEGKLRKYLTLKNIFLFIITFLLGGSWYFFLFYQNPSIFDYLIKDQLLNRVAAKKGYHIHGWYYFVFYIFPLGLLPWIFLLIKRKKEKRSKEQEKFLKALLIMSLYPLLFFSIPCSKIPLYILLSFVGFIPYLIITTSFRKKVIIVLIVIMFLFLAFLLYLIGREDIQKKLNTSKRIAKIILKNKGNKTPEIYLYKTKANALWFYSGIKPIPIKLPLIKFKKEFDLSPQELWNKFRDNEKPVFLIMKPHLKEEFSFSVDKFLLYKERKYLIFYNKIE